MAAGFREEPLQAERPLRRQLHQSRAQPITDPLAIRGLPRLSVNPASVLWRDPDPTTARHWQPMCVSAGRRAVIIKSHLVA